MKLLPVLLLFALTISSALPASGQDLLHLSVEEAVLMALESSESLRAGRAEVEVSTAQLLEARAARLPNAVAVGSYTRLGNVPEINLTIPGLETSTGFFTIPQDQYYSEVSVEQTLFAGLRVQNQIRGAESQADAAEHTLRQQEADVAFAVRSVYWTLAHANEVVGSMAAALRTVESHVRRVEALVQEGAALRVDLLAAQTRRSEVRLEVVEAENAARLAQLELNRLIGLPLMTEVRLTETESTEDVPTLEEALEEAVQHRPTLRALQSQIDALEAQVATTRGAWLPEVGAFGRYVYARPNPINLLEQDEFHGHWELGVRARWSLFDAGRPAATAAARARVTAARAQLAEARSSLEVDVSRRYLDMRRAEESLIVAEQHMEQARSTFQIFEAQYREGAVLSSQVLEAEQVLRAAEARLALARSDVAITRAALVHAIGRSW